MKKLAMLLLISGFVFSPFAFAGNNSGSTYLDYGNLDGSSFEPGGPGTGPAPNFGDGIPDGSGLEPGGSGTGPAPNSGDGIPDGSGF